MDGVRGGTPGNSCWLGTRVQEFQIQPDSCREGWLAASHDGGYQEELQFIDQSGREGLSGQVHAADGHVATGGLFQLAGSCRG